MSITYRNIPINYVNRHLVWAHGSASANSKGRKLIKSRLTTGSSPMDANHCAHMAEYWKAYFQYLSNRNDHSHMVFCEARMDYYLRKAQ